MQALNCPICGQPKVHLRLRGYYCHIQAHNQQVRALEAKELESEMRKARNRFRIRDTYFEQFKGDE